MPAVYEPKVMPRDWRGHFPHMAKRDAVVWLRFLDTYQDAFTGFAYDLALGGVTLEGLPLPEPDLLGWKYSTALKVDAVGFQDAAAWIIEVRPQATVSALGAALTYTLIAEREQALAFPLLPTIVCETIQPDVAWACAQLNINVVRV
jgi:hypothetical protein